MTYVLGLGSNIGNRERYLVAAIERIGELASTEIVARSSVYETDPVGYADQPPFLNMVIVVRSALTPHAMLDACLQIELALGRERPFPNAPRTVDMDILLINDYSESTAKLTVPHPRMWERAFVIVPLLELKNRGCLADFALPKSISVPIDQKIKIFKKS